MYNGPFRWWVQSVMPVVFDDSLSYYEVLAKLTKYIEGLTGDVDQIEKILETIEGIEDVTQFTEMLEIIKNEIGELSNLSTQSKTDLVSAINEVALKASQAYVKPSGGIPESDLSEGVQDKLNKTASATEYIINNVKLKASPSNNSPSDLGLGTYSVPAGGIPWDTLSQGVKDKIESGSSGEGGTKDYTDLINKPQINGHTLNAGNNTAENLELGTYSKPSTGIPESDLSTEVQEKLNTSGGIANSETSFVATRDYEVGELIYINGVLYKTKYKILSGTNLIPGNNIKETDISNEIEKINNDIEALQSGSGPDSWNLSAEVKSESSTEITNFFEYFNCIGGEDYNFILDPVEPTVGYSINIYKRDGTSVRAFDNTTYPNYLNRQRFTFTPTDTGEYYCTIRRSTASGTEIAHARVTIEYTQSQGISELWNKVNEASSVVEDVHTLETLVGQQQEQVETLENNVDELKSAITESTRNLLDINLMPDKTDRQDFQIYHSNGKYYIKGSYAAGNASWYSEDLPLIAGETYTCSVFCDKQINGYIRTFDAGGAILQTETISGTTKVKTVTLSASTARTVWSFGVIQNVDYGNGTEVKLQIESGTTATEYIPHISATDYILREQTAKFVTQEELLSGYVKQPIINDYELGYRYSTTNSQLQPSTQIATTTQLIHFNRGDIIALYNSDYVWVASYNDSDGTLLPGGWHSANATIQEDCDLWLGLKLVNGNDIDTTELYSVLGIEKPVSDIKTVYVATNGSDANDGNSRNTAFKTIQHAINSGAKTILVKEGTYNEAVTLSD